MIVVVTGGRHFTDGTFLFEQMDRLHAEYGFTLIVEGGQRTYRRREGKPIGGADFFAHEWAVLRGVEVRTEYAKWKDLSHPDARILKNRRGELYDANAGSRRNQVMLDKYLPERVIAFPGGSGTADMCARARAVGVEVIEVAP